MNLAGAQGWNGSFGGIAAFRLFSKKRKHVSFLGNIDELAVRTAPGGEFHELNREGDRLRSAVSIAEFSGIIGSDGKLRQNPAMNALDAGYSSFRR